MAVNFGNIGPTCQKIADMIEYGRPIVARWPRFYRDDLGRDIKQHMREMLRLATKARLRYYNKTTLAELDVEKEMLKIALREANRSTFKDKSGRERQLLSDQSYGVWSERIVEIGSMIGGWMRAINESRDKSGNTARR